MRYPHRAGLNIREVSKKTGVSEETVRKYSKLRLITPPEKKSFGREGFRGIWNASVVPQIERIQELKKEGYTLAELQERGLGPITTRLVEGAGYFDSAYIVGLAQNVAHIMPEDVNENDAFQVALEHLPLFLARVERLANKLTTKARNADKQIGDGDESGEGTIGKGLR